MSETPTTSSWDPQAPQPAPAKQGFLREFLQFAWEEKIWWITPTVLILVLLAVLVFYAQGGAIAPFFYALM